MNIPDFETFCKSFANMPAVRTVYFLRSWFITRQASMQRGSKYTDFDELTSATEILPCDYVSRIVDLTLDAFSHIVSSTHSEIIREDVMMPLYKVKEVDSYCINWLSRKSGRTIREKLAGIGSMMAVRRRESFDTGEGPAAFVEPGFSGGAEMGEPSAEQHAVIGQVLQHVPA